MPARAIPPGPPGTLLAGNLREFRQDMLGFYLRMSRQYGNLSSLRLGPRRIYLVNHPDLIEEVLVHQARNYRKHYALRMNRLLLGNGLLASEGGFWLRQRRLVQPAFTRERVAAYGAIMVDFAERMLQGWQPASVRDVHADMTQLTLEIIAKTLFDADVHGEARAAGAALAAAQESFIDRFQSLIALPEWVPSPGNLRLRRAVRRLDDIVFGFIRQRRESKEQKNDLLSLLIRARDEDGSQMTDAQLRDEAMTLFLAGHDTTALTLSWALYLLAQHPAIDARLFAEVRGVLGRHPPTVADLPRLRYTEHVLKEAMRLYPPAYAIGRESLAEAELDGYRISRGQTVLLCQWVTHRDARFWDDPEKFDPDRWAGPGIAGMPKFAYFPFGGGPRVCVGSHFAGIEAMLLLAVVVRRFRFERADSEPVKPNPSLTLRPSRGILMRLFARDGSD
jgi:cytochrome P450